MAALSLKQALASKGISLSSGIHGLHPFYESTPSHTFPYKSLRSLVRSLEWPLAFTSTGSNYDYPKDREPGWSNDLQGVTHDENYWYITQQGVLWMFPVGHDLNSSFRGKIVPIIGDNGSFSGDPSLGAGLSSSLTQKSYDHMGACDYYKGRVYIPIEGGQPPLIAAVTVHNQSLLATEKDVAPLANQIEAPWCAINPMNGLLYSSNFNIPSQDGLFVYKVSRDTGLKLDLIGKFQLFDSNGNSTALNRVQAGVFSPKGHLYLVSDTKSGGIIGFDMTTGKLSAHIPVDYQPDISVGPFNSVIDEFTDKRKNAKEELEGITIWDLDSGRAPGISGQIHLIMIDNFGSNDDDLYFKHYKVVNPEDKEKI